MNKNKELCIRCNKPAPYHPDTPITLRRYYVEGSGQLCPLCWQELYGVAPSLGVPFGTGLDQSQKVEIFFNHADEIIKMVTSSEEHLKNWNKVPEEIAEV